MWSPFWAGLALLLSVLPQAAALILPPPTTALEKADTSWASQPDEFNQGRVTFLLISSATEQKVGYIELEDFKAKHAIRPLVDAGLSAPHGLASDKDGNGVFIADSGFKRIVHYNIRMLDCAGASASDQRCLRETDSKRRHILAVEGAQTVVVDGVLCDWISMDSAGALYFTDKDKKTVNRIPANTVSNLVAGVLEPSALTYLSQYDVDTLAVAETSAKNDAAMEGHENEIRQDEVSNHIASIFQAGVSANVGTPAGIAVDDEEVYWTNSDDGRSKGSVSAGLATPLELPALPGDGAQASAALKSRLIADNTDSAYGLAVSRENIVYTGEHVVYGVAKLGGPVAELSGTLSSPRGLAWDGDYTMFVADEEGSTVYSFPCGRLAAGLQFSTVVSVHRPVGLSLVSFYAEPVSLYSQSWRSMGYRRNCGICGCVLSLVVIMVAARR